jgi:hypothetical protein
MTPSVGAVGAVGAIGARWRRIGSAAVAAMPVTGRATPRTRPRGASSEAWWPSGASADGDGWLADRPAANGRLGATSGAGPYEPLIGGTRRHSPRGPAGAGGADGERWISLFLNGQGRRTLLLFVEALVDARDLLYEALPVAVLEIENLV